MNSQNLSKTIQIMENVLKLSEDGKTILGLYDKNVESITIPDGVTSIGDAAFCWCCSLKSITLPDSVTSIGDAAFSCCKSLQSINVSEDNAHYTSIDGILFNKDLTAIIKFPERKELKEYNIPDGVTSIGECAFCNCSSLESITLPDSVTSIGECAFCNCSSLESITLPDSVTSIGECAFDECSSLENITLPDSVTFIGDCAFYGCSSLESITLPSGVTSIVEGAFSGCSSLKSIDVSGDNAYYTSVDGILFNKDLTTIVRFPQGYELKEYTLPDSVTSIDECAFYGCSSL